MLKFFDDLDELGPNEERPVGIIGTLEYQFYIGLQYVGSTDVDTGLKCDIVWAGDIACKLVISVPGRVVVGRIGKLQRYTAIIRCAQHN